MKVKNSDYSILLLTLIALGLLGCKNEKKQFDEIHSLAIVDCYGCDPLNPRPFNEYNSPMVCVLAFKVSEDSVTYYKSYGSKRFILKKKINSIEKERLKGIVESIFSKKDRGDFGESEIENKSRIYCGPTYIPIIENKRGTKLKLVAESMPDIPTVDSMNFQWSSKTFMINENWIELNNNQFLPFVLCSEQYANLQMPKILSAPFVKPIPPIIKK